MKHHVLRIAYVVHIELHRCPNIYNRKLCFHT